MRLVYVPRARGWLGVSLGVEDTTATALHQAPIIPPVVHCAEWTAANRRGVARDCILPHPKNSGGRQVWLRHAVVVRILAGSNPVLRPNESKEPPIGVRGLFLDLRAVGLARYGLYSLLVLYYTHVYVTCQQ